MKHIQDAIEILKSRELSGYAKIKLDHAIIYLEKQDEFPYEDGTIIFTDSYETSRN